MIIYLCYHFEISLLSYTYRMIINENAIIFWYNFAEE